MTGEQARREKYKDAWLTANMKEQEAKKKYELAKLKFENAKTRSQYAWDNYQRCPQVH